SGQPGETGAYPAPSKSLAQRSQLVGSSHSPWMNTTGRFPDALALSTWFCSCLVTVFMADTPFDAVVAAPSSMNPLPKGRMATLSLAVLAVLRACAWSYAGAITPGIGSATSFAPQHPTPGSLPTKWACHGRCSVRRAYGPRGGDGECRG